MTIDEAREIINVFKARNLEAYKEGDKPHILVGFMDILEDIDARLKVLEGDG